MFKCDCGKDIDNTMTHALLNNVCPFCGSGFLDDDTREKIKAF